MCVRRKEVTLRRYGPSSRASRFINPQCARMETSRALSTVSRGPTSQMSASDLLCSAFSREGGNVCKGRKRCPGESHRLQKQPGGVSSNQCARALSAFAEGKVVELAGGPCWRMHVHERFICRSVHRHDGLFLILVPRSGYTQRRKTWHRLLTMTCQEQS